MPFGLFKIGRGGRSFLREVMIIILGVLVALALEQLASNWRDRQRMDDIRASMDEELADFADVLRIRLLASPCAVAKLDAIDAVLGRSGASGPWRNVGRPPFFYSSRGAWNSDASDLMSRHLGPGTFRSYGEVYQGMEHFAALMQQEQDFWIALQTLERQDEPIAGERRWRLVEATVGARNANLLQTAIAEQTLARIRELGVQPNNAVPVAELRARPICQRLTFGGANG